MLEAVILAAGKGTRMKSNLPKVMHPIAGKPMLQHVLDSAAELAPEKIHLVLGHGAEVFREHIAASANLDVVLQEQQLGTGHAVMQVLPKLSPASTTLILYGDVPLIRADTLRRLAALANDQTLALLTVRLADPTGYGRILRDEQNLVAAIVEQKDATPEQLALNEVNTGFMAIPSQFLREYLPQLSNQNAGRVLFDRHYRPRTRQRLGCYLVGNGLSV